MARSSLIDWIGGAMFLLGIYAFACFIVAAFIAHLSGGDPVDAGLENIRSHWEMWTGWIGR